MRKPNWPLLALTAALLAATSTTRAYLIAVYDLDSQTYMSDAIAEIAVSGPKEGHPEIIECIIIKVYKGGLKEGDTLALADTSIYHFDLSSNKSLSPNDRFFAVLQKSPDDRNKTDIQWHLISGGLHFISNGKVLDFSQMINPGPLVPDFNSDRAPTIAAFITSLNDSIQKTAALKKKLASLDPAKNGKELLQLYINYSATLNNNGWNTISSEIAAKLGATHDPELLDKVITTPNLTDTYLALRGFGTPEGREFILAKIADPALPMSTRISYSNVLCRLSSKYFDIDGTPSVPVKDQNHHYLQRIAQLAFDNSAQTDLCSALLIAPPAVNPITTDDIDFQNDAAAAVAILQKLYSKTTNQTLQYQIEVALSNNTAAYEKLASPCGHIISTVTLANGQSPKITDRLRVDASYFCLLPSPPGPQVPFTLTFILQSTTDKTQYSLPATYDSVRSNSSGVWSEQFSIRPGTLPAGSYRVFFTCNENGKVISQSHYVEIEIPK